MENVFWVSGGVTKWGGGGSAAVDQLAVGFLSLYS